MAWNVGTTMENTANGYLTEATNVKGGFFVIDNLANLPGTYQKTPGVLCYQTSDGKFYQWNGDASTGQWYEKSFEAPARYMHYIRITQNNTLKLDFSFPSTDDGTNYTGDNSDDALLASELLYDSVDEHIIPATGVWAANNEVRLITGIQAYYYSGAVIYFKIYYSFIAKQIINNGGTLEFNSTATEGSSALAIDDSYAVNKKIIRTC